jgi:putative transposase
MCPPSETNRPPHAKNLREGRWSETFACYAVAKCLARRRPILAEPAQAGIILASLSYLRETETIRLLSFCIMPDHYHVVFFLVGRQPLSEVMGSLGKYTARRLNQLFHHQGQFWEEGFFDHRCRNEDDIEDRMTYIEHNPVRAELVTKAEDWLFSSAHPSQASLLDRDWYARMRWL